MYLKNQCISCLNLKTKLKSWTANRFLMIPGGEKWHYLAVKIFALLRRIT